MRKIISILAVLAAFAVPVAGVTAANALTPPRFSGGYQTLCPDYGTSQQCVYPASGTPIGGGDGVNIGPGNWHVVLDGITFGTVGNSWPFTPGSGYNTQYQGHKIWSIEWNVDTNYCLSSRGEWSNHVSSNVCSTSLNQAWVESGGWLINVGGTNTAYLAGASDPRQVLTNHGASNCADNGVAWVDFRGNSGGGSNCYNNWS